MTLLRERLVDAAFGIAIGALLYLADPVVRWLVVSIARRDLLANP